MAPARAPHASGLCAKPAAAINERRKAVVRAPSARGDIVIVDASRIRVHLRFSFML
jgi:hypothetical protein